MGALVAHIGAKIHVAREALARADGASTVPDGADAELGRRQFLATAFGTSAVLTIVTVGQTVRPLARLGLLAPRRPDVGPQGLPVNKTAAGAHVTPALTGAGVYRLVVRGDVARPLELTLEELRAMPQREVVLPIACVEGWSAAARWRGVPVRDLLARAGVRDGADVDVRVESLQTGGSFRKSDLNHRHASDPDTLLALEIDGEVLHPDHGFPVRLIGPNRPGVLQTKWVNELVVQS